MRNWSRVFSFSIPSTALSLALLVLGGACAPSAMADTVYSYTGAPFTQCFGTYVADCGSLSLKGTLDLSLSVSQLDNLDKFLIPASDIVSFSFHDGFAASLNQLTAADAAFVISTNSQGQITQWGVMLLSGIPAAGTVGNETLIGIFGGVGLNNGSFSGNDVKFDCTKSTAPPTGCKATVEDNDLIDGGETLGGGAWSLPQAGTSAPTPEPSSLLLLSSGLLALGPVTRRFAQR